jgi:hypothetical protein
MERIGRVSIGPKPQKHAKGLALASLGVEVCPQNGVLAIAAFSVGNNPTSLRPRD